MASPTAEARAIRTSSTRAPALAAAALLLTTIPVHSPATAAAPDPGVRNGGAERGTTAWSVSGEPGARLSTSTTSRSGSRAVRVHSERPVRARVDVRASTAARDRARGTTGTAEVWIRTAATGQEVTVVAREVTASGRWVQSRRRSTTPTADTWTAVRVPLTTRRPGSTLRVRLVLPANDSGLDVLVDDVSLTTGPPRASVAAGLLTTGCRHSARGIPSCGAYFGAAYGANTDPAPFEQQAGRRLGVRRTFFDARGVASAVRHATADLARGRLPWISFKLPHSWEKMAAGAGDAWVTDLARRLAALDGPVWVAFHHEPEGDGDIDAWRRMQEHLAPIVRGSAPNVAYTVVLTGWNQFYGDAAYRLDNLWPRTKVDVAGFDLYNEYGVVKDGRRITEFPDFDDRYFRRLQTWAAEQDVAWGMAEWAYTDEGHAEDPDWIERTFDQMVARGGVAAAYFNTEVNAYGSWRLGSGSKRQDFANGLRGSAALPLP
ncbi:carbohydrate-binding protein CenC [Nocardioides sp. zg-579]|uniref:Carbohydrate-binding protein CenC n=1 Tax=Nocardioides marmotae TaxID=2663857 RepID=A0A6I3JEX5_9ACTN|nr:carbohydrate-binding protein CenC [Nocardioides marmotae]MTB96583.1 carbohydrate-binding protein CenC [Nocardioides marmotae]QKE01900.1 carbohydrate-binding protein CenC [Nocardioides marmotae]